MIQAPENFVLCEIERKFHDKEGGLIIDPTWHPEEHATLEGIVASAPVRIQATVYDQVFSPVKNGDKIIFSYTVIFKYKTQADDDTPVYANLIIYEGKEYWKVAMDEIFCRITLDGVQMITDNVLIEPLPGSSLTTGKVVGMPDIKLSCDVDNIIIFEAQYVQEYKIFERRHFIIPSRRVIAKLN